MKSETDGQDAREILHGPQNAIERLNVQAHEGGTTDSASDTRNSIEARLARLEEHTDTEFVRRETRFIPALLGLFAHAPGGIRQGKGRAALTAFLWRIFSPGAVAAATGGSLLLIFTGIQAALVWQQNQKLDQQTDLMQSQANVGSAVKVAEIVEALTSHAADFCLTKAGDPDKKCWLEVHPNARSMFLSACRTNSSCKSDFLARAKPLPPNLGILAATKSVDAQLLPATRALETQIVAVTALIRPYRFIDTDAELRWIGRPPKEDGLLGRAITAVLQNRSTSTPILTNRPLSPERGLLLSHMVSTGLDTWTRVLRNADFSSAYVRKPNFAGTNLVVGLSLVSMPLADLSESTLTGFLSDSDFVCAKFDNANLESLEVVSGDYRGASFDGAILPKSPAAFRPGDFTAATLDGARVTSLSWLAEFAALKAVGFNKEEWTIAQSSEQKNEWRIRRVAGASAKCPK